MAAFASRMDDGKSLRCNLCSTYVTQKRFNMRTHLEGKHQMSNGYTCDLCSVATYKTKQEVNQHKRLCKNRPYWVQQLIKNAINLKQPMMPIFTRPGDHLRQQNRGREIRLQPLSDVCHPQKVQHAHPPGGNSWPERGLPVWYLLCRRQENTADLGQAQTDLWS